MSTLLNNQYLLYDGDYQILENEDWQYLERMNGTIDQECVNKDTGAIVYGTGAFSLCSDNIN